MSSCKLKINLSRLSFNNFLKLISQIVPECYSDTTIKYVDDDGDEILLTTQEDYNLAKELSLKSDNKINIFVYDNISRRKIHFDKFNTAQLLSKQKDGKEDSNNESKDVLTKSYMTKMFETYMVKIADEVAKQTASQVITSLHGAVLEAPVSEMQKLIINLQDNDRSTIQNTTTTIHKNVICDICEQEIVGIRYICLNCSNFDLCANCEKCQPHNPSHIFGKLYRPVNRSIDKPLLDQIVYDDADVSITVPVEQPADKYNYVDEIASASDTGCQHCFGDEFEVVMHLPDCFKLDGDAELTDACYTQQDIERIRARLDQILNSRDDSHETSTATTDDGNYSLLDQKLEEEGFVPFNAMAAIAAAEVDDEEEFVVANEPPLTTDVVVSETKPYENLQLKVDLLLHHGDFPKVQVPESNTVSLNFNEGQNSPDAAQESRNQRTVYPQQENEKSHNLLQSASRMFFDVYNTLRAQETYTPPSPPMMPSLYSEPPSQKELFTRRPTDACVIPRNCEQPSPMQILIEMGFGNRQANQRALSAVDGDVERAVERLIHDGMRNGDWSIGRQ